MEFPRGLGPGPAGGGDGGSRLGTGQEASDLVLVLVGEEEVMADSDCLGERCVAQCGGSFDQVEVPLGECGTLVGEQVGAWRMSAPSSSARVASFPGSAGT